VRGLIHIHYAPMATKSCVAAKWRDVPLSEVASFYSITLSARMRRVPSLSWDWWSA